MSLPHTFDTDCSLNQKIKNTYFYKAAINEQITANEINSCEGNKIILDNIMDYYGFNNSFTDGQVERMRNYYEESNLKMPSIAKVLNLKNARANPLSKIYICK